MANRDGVRSGYVAGHEAAHAVVAVVSGWAVGRVTIAPNRRERELLGGYADVMPTDPSWRWHIPLSPTAAADVAAAGQAWDTLMAAEDLFDGVGNPLEAVSRLPCDVKNFRDAWRAGGGDRAAVSDYGVPRAGYLAGVVRMLVALRRPGLRAAVLQTRARLVSSRSGEIWGTSVEQICETHGLVPVRYLDRPSARAARSAGSAIGAGLGVEVSGQGSVEAPLPWDGHRGVHGNPPRSAQEGTA